MQSQEHHSGFTPSKPGCTVTVHHAQSLHIISENQVKIKFSAPQLEAVKQVFLAVMGQHSSPDAQIFSQINAIPYGSFYQGQST